MKIFHLAFFSLLPLLAHTASAQVSGIVVDAAGAPLPGAIVTLQATSQRVTTAPDGTFSLPNVPPGFATIVGAHQGWYNATAFTTAPATGVRIQCDPVVIGNDPNYALVDPTGCAVCHPDQHAQWDGSPMAHGGHNGWVYDIYDGSGTPGGQGGFVYLRDSVHAPHNPASECAACHQPEVWIKRNGSALDPIGNLSTEALHGVSCEVCHKIANIDETKPNFPGIWPGVVTHNRPAAPLFDHQVEYGRLGDSSIEIGGVMRPSYQPQFDAAICAACHQDKNDPDRNGNFEEPNGVISEPTYLEWLASPYGDPNSAQYTSCVDCHMPPTNSPYASVMMHPQRPAGQVRSHLVQGTTPAYLENAVDMATTVTQVGDRLHVDVQVHNNQTGHHVPTGVTVRNVILLVEAWDVRDGTRLAQTLGPVVHRLGGVGDPRQGYYAGLPGKVFAKHNHDASGQGPTFYTDATGIVWDTRIPAGATDATSYEFAVGATAGTLRVRARLVYRRAFRFLVDAKGWTTDGHGEPLEDVQAPYFGHLMEETLWQGAGEGAVRAFGPACRGLTAGHEGDPSLGNSAFAFTLDGALANAPAFLGLGFDNTQWAGYRLPLDLSLAGAPGCWLLTALDVTQREAVDPAGHARSGLPIPPFAPIGATFYAQWLVADPGLPLGIAFSDAVAVTVQR